MPYTPKTDWQLDNVVQPEDINRMEQGIADAHNEKLNANANAVSASKLQTGRTITLSGAVTGISENFDGTKNITIIVSEVDATKLKGLAAINTSGNAGTATKLQTTRKISLSGGVTGTATDFDGTKDIAIPVTSINPTNLSAPVPVNKGGTGVANLNVNKLKTDTNSDTFVNIYLSPTGDDNATGLSSTVPMKTIRAAVGRYGGLNRIRLNLAPGTYTDTSTVTISGSVYVDISGTSTTPGSTVITHPIIFQSTDAKVTQLTFDLSNSNETYPGLTLRQSKYDIQNCVFKGKPTVHAGINVSLGSSGYIFGCTFQTGIRGVEVGSGASMTALSCSVATGFEIGFNVNGGTLISGGNTNNAITKFTMYNSAVIFNDGVLLNPVTA